MLFAICSQHLAMCGPLTWTDKKELLVTAGFCKHLLQQVQFGGMYVCRCILIILLSQESDQCAITSSLRSCRPPVYHAKMGESR